ncbi:MAG: hypothetical protein AB7F59_06185 [Bdellovibrionales bacterium]
MRYLSLLILTAIIFISWKVTQLEAKVHVRVHHDIQMDLSKIIAAAVKAQLPNSSEVKFDKLFSETLDADHVRVSFSYNYKDATQDDNTEMKITGDALVTRNTNDRTQWTLEKINVDQSAIEFKNGLVVTKEAGAQEEFPPAETEESLNQ